MEDREKSMETDQKYIEDMFEQDGLEVPESLSRGSMASMLAKADEEKGADKNGVSENIGQDEKNGQPERKTVRKRSRIRIIGWAAAIAACLMLAVIPALNAGRADAAELTVFSSYDEIYKLIDEINSRNSAVYEEKYYAVQEEADMVEGEAGAAANEGFSAKSSGRSLSAAGGQDHSETYIQVEGVDEADKVKTDGEYLYFIDSTGSRIMIYRADNGKAAMVSSIKAEQGMIYSDIFLRGDRIVAIGDRYDAYTFDEDSDEQGGASSGAVASDSYYDSGSEDDSVNGYFGAYSSAVTVAAIYDVADRKSPVKTAEYVQSGSSVSQRMVGDVLYLVSDQYIYGREVPYCGASEKPEKLKAEEISCVPSPARAEYTVIGAVDTSSGKELSHAAKAVFGGSQDIYSNGENLYIAGATFIRTGRNGQDEGPVRRFIMPYAPGYPATMVIKVRLAGGNIKITDTAVVEGTIDDQFSMDERNGEFRIATTSFADGGEEVNKLFVLDRNLSEIGSVSGFAKGESIKAVRYIRDKAYVITYEQTDPLFVIDLSDSRAPKIEGEVKIDGFSTLLVPLSEDRLLGIGYGTRQVESWQETSGIKFVLFDISDPSDPKVVASKEKDRVFSSVQDDHRALVMIGEGEDARFILPCRNEPDDFTVEFGQDTDVIEDAEESDVYVEPEEEQEDRGLWGGVLTISAADDRIDEISYDKTRDSVERCPVIGDYIYAITDTDEVVAVRLAA